MTQDRSPTERPRLLPDRSLPPYSYVTGKFPHPTRDPRGHSFGLTEPVVSLPDGDDCRRCDAYLWGVDLFNWGFYWEAHESWEAVWHAAGRRGPLADFCKALIKLAAAGVKAREARPQGVAQHGLRASQLLRAVAESTAGGDIYLGQSLASLIGCADALAERPQAVVCANDAPVAIVLTYIMRVAL
jgi:uncharacterized protein